MGPSPRFGFTSPQLPDTEPCGVSSTVRGGLGGGGSRNWEGIGALPVPCLAHRDWELSPHESAESKPRKRFCIRNVAGTHVAPSSAGLPWVAWAKGRMDFRRTGARWKNVLGEDFSAVAQWLEVFGAACLIPLNQRAGFLGELSIRHPQALPFPRAPFLGSSVKAGALN